MAQLPEYTAFNMKSAETQIITNTENSAEMAQKAEYMVMQAEMGAQESESKEAEMRTKVEQALAAKIRREQAERNSAESEHKIQEAVA
jgi:hypothetical protein